MNLNKQNINQNKTVSDITQDDKDLAYLCVYRDITPDSFITIPRYFFKVRPYAQISCQAMILYGLMLERVGISILNGWCNQKCQVYIHYSIAETCSILNISRPTAVKVHKELETVGLIQKISGGTGKPSRIYVREYIG